MARLLDRARAHDAWSVSRAGTHEVDGRVTVADLLVFLPGHQQDHAEQLTALVGRLPG